MCRELGSSLRKIILEPVYVLAEFVRHGDLHFVAQGLFHSVIVWAAHEVKDLAHCIHRLIHDVEAVKVENLIRMVFENGLRLGEIAGEEFPHLGPDFRTIHPMTGHAAVGAAKEQMLPRTSLRWRWRWMNFASGKTVRMHSRKTHIFPVL